MKGYKIIQLTLLLAVLAVSVCADAAQAGRSLLARRDAQLTLQMLPGQAENEHGHHGKHKCLHGKRLQHDLQATCSFYTTKGKHAGRTNTMNE
jgi:hypothetical protein